MRRFGEARLTLDERLRLEAALDDAFGPLRARGTRVSAARVRAAVRWHRPDPPRLRGLGLVTRLSEIAIAAAVSAFLFAGSVASVAAPPPIPDLSRDAVTVGDRMLNGRNAFQRPISSLFKDYRMTAGDLAMNAATARRSELEAPSPSVRDSEPFAARP